MDRFRLHRTIHKKEEKEKKEQSRDLHNDIRGVLPIQILSPGPTGLNLRVTTEKKKPVLWGLLRDA